MSWEKKKFIDFILLQRGHDLTKEQIKLGIYPVVTSTSIMGYHNAYKAEGPGVITGRSGTIGEVQYVEENYWPHNTSLYVKDFKGNYPKFVYYFMKNFGTDRVQGGSAVPTLNRNNLSGIDVYIPDFESQQRIASVLEKYDDLIENNQKQIKLLEEAAQRLYKEWFIDLRFPGYEGMEIVDGVPSGWKKTVLNEVFSFERGKSYASKELSDSEGVVLVNLKNIQAWGGYKREAEKRFIGKYKESQTVEFGDIVMAVTDMTQERRLVGHVALVPDLGEKATYSMDLIKLIPSKGINSFFLYSSLRYSGIAENISKHANGTNVLHLKPDSIMGLEYIIPSAELMDLFGSMVETICKKVEVLQSQMILLSNARDRLLPKLMSGEIEV